MERYLDILLDGYTGYARYLWYEITHPGWHNYFYWLLGVSAFFLVLEWTRPWRKDQAKFRKDFWWDYLFKTAEIPCDGRDIELGFPGSEASPKTFIGQNLHGPGLAEKRHAEAGSP